MEQEVVQSRYKKDDGQDQILDIFLKWSIIPKLVLCLAAPGTGKTTTIVRLLLELIMLGRKSPIQNFMVLTFTKRTRDDILKKFEDEGRSDLIEKLKRVVRNFHSLAFTSLFWDDIITDTNITSKVKELGEATGMKVSGQDGYKVRIIVKKLKEAIASNKVQETIDTQMANNQTYGNIMQECIDWLQQSFEKNKSISYDYALIKFIKRLNQGRNPFKIDLSQIQLLIVDQFQDSNPAQMKIVECILARNPKMRLLLMGDIDQTIYTWRGTDLIQLDQFIEGYNARNEYKRVLLQYTHRLGSQVVKYSQNLIRSRENYLRFRQKYYGDYQPIPLNIKNDHAPIVIQFESQYSQVNWVINKIRQLNTKFGIHYKDMTVLLRSFKFTHFFNKFKFQNQRLAAINKVQKIPFTVKSDQKYQNLQTILAWLVYFYKKKYLVRKSTEAEIKTILKHMKATPTTIKKMTKINRIDEECLYKKGRGWTAQKMVMWDSFFIDFSNIEKMMDEIESFRQIFEALYSHLSPKKRCPQLSQYERNEFLEYVALLQAHIKKQKPKKGPIFAIIQELIKSNIYEVKASKNHVKKVKQQVKLQEKQQKQDKQKKSSKKTKQKLQKKQNFRTLNYFYPNIPEPKQQQKPGQKQVKLQEEQVIIDQTQQLISQQNQSQRQKRMQNIELNFTGQADSVQFQTVYKAKGLQFKVVFICSLNYDYRHEDYDPSPQPHNGYRNDELRQRQRARDLNRQIVKQEEQLRVVYTALTRTSKYSFITASNYDCMMPEYSVKHPHFITLKKYSENSQYVVPFELQEDIQFKEAYEQHLKRQKPSKNKKVKQEEVSKQK